MTEHESPVTLWDPLATLRPELRRMVWFSLACWAVALLGWDSARYFVPEPIVSSTSGDVSVFVPDFFQDFASAKNWHNGINVYTEHRAIFFSYVPEVNSTNDTVDRLLETFRLNAHPPTSVLLVLPLGKLTFSTARLVWNVTSLVALLTSLWIVWRELKIPFAPWSLAPMVALLLLCHPVWMMFRLGQSGAILLLLIVGSWKSARSGHPLWAGALLGLATAIKLYPAFLFFYFAWRRKWTIVASGAVALAGISALTAAVLGPETYRRYILEVLPETQWYRVCWENSSIAGFWSKLFDVQPTRVRSFSRLEPLWQQPAVFLAGWLLSCSAVLAVLASAVRPHRDDADDQGFSLAVTAMLLVSPVTWEHYFVILLLPLTVVWLNLPSSRPYQIAFAAILICLWLDPRLASYPVIPGSMSGPAKPVHSLTVLSIQSYALVGLFALGVLITRRDDKNTMRVFAQSPETA